MDKFAGLKVSLSTGEKGIIDGAFGQSGKFKMTFRGGLQPATLAQLKAMKKKKGKGADADDDDDAAAAAAPGQITVFLQFKKYVFDASHRLIQT